MYGIGGERELTEQTLDHLSGYDGARPVRIAWDQRQHVGVPGMQAFIEADPARLMRDMVLKNQVLSTFDGSLRSAKAPT